MISTGPAAREKRRVFGRTDALDAHTRNSTERATERREAILNCLLHSSPAERFEAHFVDVVAAVFVKRRQFDLFWIHRDNGVVLPVAGVPEFLRRCRLPLGEMLQVGPQPAPRVPCVAGVPLLLIWCRDLLGVDGDARRVQSKREVRHVLVECRPESTDHGSRLVVGLEIGVSSLETDEANEPTVVHLRRSVVEDSLDAVNTGRLRVRERERPTQPAKAQRRDDAIGCSRYLVLRRRRDAVPDGSEKRAETEQRAGERERAAKEEDVYRGEHTRYSWNRVHEISCRNPADSHPSVDPRRDELRRVLLCRCTVGRWVGW